MEKAMFRYSCDVAVWPMSAKDNLDQTGFVYNHMDYQTRVIDALRNTTKVCLTV